MKEQFHVLVSSSLFPSHCFPHEHFHSTPQTPLESERYRYRQRYTGVTATLQMFLCLRKMQWTESIRPYAHIYPHKYYTHTYKLLKNPQYHRRLSLRLTERALCNEQSDDNSEGYVTHTCASFVSDKTVCGFVKCYHLLLSKDEPRAISIALSFVFIGSLGSNVAYIQPSIYPFLCPSYFCLAVYLPPWWRWSLSIFRANLAEMRRHKRNL